jgi:hypothetical protein
MIARASVYFYSSGHTYVPAQETRLRLLGRVFNELIDYFTKSDFKSFGTIVILKYGDLIYDLI